MTFIALIFFTFKERPLLTNAGGTPFPTMLLPHQPGSETFIDNMAAELGFGFAEIF